MRKFLPDDEDMFDDEGDSTPGLSAEELEQMQQLLGDMILLGLREGKPLDQPIAPPVQWFRDLPEQQRNYVEDIVRSAVATTVAAMQEMGREDDLTPVRLDSAELLEAMYEFDQNRPTYVDLAGQALVERDADDTDFIYDEDGAATHVRIPSPGDESIECLQEFLETQPREVRKAGQRLLDKKDGYRRCIAELKDKHPEAFDSWIVFHAENLLEELAERMADVGFALELEDFHGEDA